MEVESLPVDGQYQYWLDMVRGCGGGEGKGKGKGREKEGKRGRKGGERTRKTHLAKILSAAASLSFKYALSSSTSSNLGGVDNATRSALLLNPKSVAFSSCLFTPFSGCLAGSECEVATSVGAVLEREEASGAIALMRRLRWGCGDWTGGEVEERRGSGLGGRVC